jgi:hypothetical protein
MGIERQQLALKFKSTICKSLKHASNFQCLSKYIIGNLYKVQNCGDAWDAWKCIRNLHFCLQEQWDFLEFLAPSQLKIFPHLL